MSKVTQEVNFEAVHTLLFLFPLSPFPCQVVLQLQSNRELCIPLFLSLEICIFCKFNRKHCNFIFSSCSHSKGKVAYIYV